MTTALGWAIVAIVSAAGLGVYAIHHWAYKPVHAAPKAPGAGDAGDSRARDKTPGGSLAPPPSAPAGPGDEPTDAQWYEAVHGWAEEERKRKRAARDEERGRAGPPLAAPVADTSILGTQPWEPAPAPAVVEPAMTPLREDERHPDYGWLYGDEREPQQRGEPDDYDIPLDREALETGTIIPGPGPDGWRELPAGCDLCGSPGHETTGHDQYTATARQADAATRQANVLLAGVMLWARTQHEPQPVAALPAADPRWPHLSPGQYADDTGRFAAICAADDSGGGNG